METAKLKKAIQQPDVAVDYLWHRAFSLFGHDHYKRFIVLGTDHLLYEDLVSRLNTEFESITNFLGLPFNHPKTQYIKLNPEKPSTLIANYESLKREFSGTEWAHFFEEEPNI